MAEFELGAGQRLPFVLSWHPSHAPLPPALEPEQALARTEAFWRDWCERCTYHGDWADEVQERLRDTIEQFAEDFGYDLDEEGQPIEEGDEDDRRRPSERGREEPEAAGEEQEQGEREGEEEEQGEKVGAASEESEA